MIVMVTGGARSGKSTFAEKLAPHLADRGVYIATSQTWDEEMKERVSLHQQRRERGSFAWQTIEEPIELSTVLMQLEQRYRGQPEPPVILVDCMTLWLSNWLLQDTTDTDTTVQDALQDMMKQLSVMSLSVILVTNEVGDGIVPAYPLGRQFRDWAGWMNQEIALNSEKVFRVTAGLAVELKRLAVDLDQENGWT
ncbi:bifunctional adenosylcobinamide kinase/adenosylcobinamide-phosphate guanylyltransferase [Marinicrinis sediminis]|uniref:Adenosylcobinamide kinase n=1 Tax=Marinicrinis sediminis TaxID=1652465 RepID=A0ABW5R5K4_9BACL